MARAPARFILLFIAFEAMLEHRRASDEMVAHVNRLINLTKEGELSPEEKEGLCSILSFQKQQSIASSGKNLADTVLQGKRYGGLEPGDFFKMIYKIRNKMVHQGVIEPRELHVTVGDVDQFVSDVISAHTGSVKLNS